MVLEALTTVHWLVATWLEWDHGGLAAIGAYCFKHLTWCTLTVFLCTECSTAFGAATRLILEAFLSVEFLLRC